MSRGIHFWEASIVGRGPLKGRVSCQERSVFWEVFIVERGLLSGGVRFLGGIHCREVSVVGIGPL